MARLRLRGVLRPRPRPQVTPYHLAKMIRSSYPAIHPMEARGGFQYIRFGGRTNELYFALYGGVPRIGGSGLSLRIAAAGADSEDS